MADQTSVDGFKNRRSCFPPRRTAQVLRASTGCRLSRFKRGVGHGKGGNQELELFLEGITRRVVYPAGDAAVTRGGGEGVVHAIRASLQRTDPMRRVDLADDNV